MKHPLGVLLRSKIDTGLTRFKPLTLTVTSPDFTSQINHTVDQNDQKDSNRTKITAYFILF